MHLEHRVVGEVEGGFVDDLDRAVGQDPVTRGHRLQNGAFDPSALHEVAQQGRMAGVEGPHGCDDRLLVVTAALIGVVHEDRCQQVLDRGVVALGVAEALTVEACGIGCGDDPRRGAQPCVGLGGVESEELERRAHRVALALGHDAVEPGDLHEVVGQAPALVLLDGGQARAECRHVDTGLGEQEPVRVEPSTVRSAQLVDAVDLRVEQRLLLDVHRAVGGGDGDAELEGDEGPGVGRRGGGHRVARQPEQDGLVSVERAGTEAHVGLDPDVVALQHLGEGDRLAAARFAVPVHLAPPRVEGGGVHAGQRGVRERAAGELDQGGRRPLRVRPGEQRSREDRHRRRGARAGRVAVEPAHVGGELGLDGLGEVGEQLERGPGEEDVTRVGDGDLEGRR